MVPRSSTIHRLVTAQRSAVEADDVLSRLAVDPLLLADEAVERGHVAMALNALLFADLLERVPTAAAYVAEVAARGERIQFDHGALRTIDGPSGALPSGHAAFARLLQPLGYVVGGTYPLPRLKMTGHAFVHADFPESVPQFFVSELHVADLAPDAQDAAARVFATSADPLDEPAHDLLDALARDEPISLARAVAGMPALVRAFGRQHMTPALADYQALLVHSPEAAWIATEGNAFNHATDRVPDVTALAAELKAQGLPLKPEVEHSANGRVHQTAFLADTVRRRFDGGDGESVEREVPGSFYEFITRDVDPATGLIDLGFDSANATGIFAVTDAR